jgi:hypothetical protein
MWLLLQPPYGSISVRMTINLDVAASLWQPDFIMSSVAPRVGRLGSGSLLSVRACMQAPAWPCQRLSARACMQVLRDCRTTSGITASEVQRTKTTLLARHEAELKDTQYILNLLTHLQAVDVPLKTIDTLRDLPAMMLQITAEDLNDSYALFGLKDDEIVSSIATSGPQQPDPPPALKMQTDAESAKLSPGLSKSRSVTDMMMQALAQAMMQQMQTRTPPASGEANGAASPATRNGTVPDAVDVKSRADKQRGAIV